MFPGVPSAPPWARLHLHRSLSPSSTHPGLILSVFSQLWPIFSSLPCPLFIQPFLCPDGRPSSPDTLQPSTVCSPALGSQPAGRPSPAAWAGDAGAGAAAGVNSLLNASASVSRLLVQSQRIPSETTVHYHAELLRAVVFVVVLKFR